MELRSGRRPGLSGSMKYRGVCGPSGRRPGYTRPGRRKPAKRRGILWSRWLLAPRWGAKTAHAIAAATAPSAAQRAAWPSFARPTAGFACRTARLPQ